MSVAVVIVALLSVLAGVLLSTSRMPRALPALLAIAIAIAIACAAPWLAFVAYYAHALDGAAYYEWRSSPWTDLLAGLVGVPVGVVVSRSGAARQRAIACAVGACAAMALVVVAFAKPALTRMPRSWVKDTWRGDVCIQSTPATCGLCAAATLLRAMGIEGVNESALAVDASSTTSGTLNWLLARALRERDVDVRFRDVASLDDVQAPAIIGVRLGAVGHFVAYLGRDDEGAFIVGEPLQGRLVLTRAQFAERYAFDAFAMELAPAK